MLIRRGERVRLLPRAVASVLIGAAFLNPAVEGIEYNNAILFMFSHYALFAAGLLLSYRLTRLPSVAVLPGAAIAVLWHLPYPFAVSGALFTYRVMEESTLVMGGWFVGSSLTGMSSNMKSLLLALWFSADTALTILFLVLPQLYSRAIIPASPYSPSEFVLLGVAMIFFMNGIIAYLVYRYVKKYRPLLLSEEL